MEGPGPTYLSSEADTMSPEGSTATAATCWGVKNGFIRGYTEGCAATAAIWRGWQGGGAEGIICRPWGTAEMRGWRAVADLRVGTGHINQLKHARCEQGPACVPGLSLCDLTQPAARRGASIPHYCSLLTWYACPLHVLMATPLTGSHTMSVVSLEPEEGVGCVGGSHDWGGSHEP